MVMEGALVEEMSMVADGTVVHPGRRIPSGQLWAGNPAVFVRNLTKHEISEMEKQAEDYTLLAMDHAEHFMPFQTAYQHAEQLGVDDETLRKIVDMEVERELRKRAPQSLGMESAASERQ